MRPKKLARSFYEQPTLEVAEMLLGKYLVHKSGRQDIVGKIVETEAYVGPEDRACHASRGRTKRTEVMFGPAGHAYVYLIYGMYYCFNVVTESEGYPAAVLVRAVEPVEASLTDGKPMTNGPGKLCRFFHIDKTLNGIDLCGSQLSIEDHGERVSPLDIVRAKRIGVEYAGEWKEKPWRFYIKGNKFVSKVER
jgi:DNA-3-methyladenine glycosylase